MNKHNLIIIMYLTFAITLAIMSLRILVVEHDFLVGIELLIVCVMDALIAYKEIKNNKDN